MTSDIDIDIYIPFQTLISNSLRERVALRVDGGFKSGVDVVMAAAMGADEFGFGSIAMIATGCIMARICHTNNCPVGVASQVRLCLFSLVLYMIFLFLFWSGICCL
jgi:glutamate synthase domain-containing protein 2